MPVYQLQGNTWLNPISAVEGDILQRSGRRDAAARQTSTARRWPE